MSIKIKTSRKIFNSRNSLINILMFLGLVVFFIIRISVVSVKQNALTMEIVIDVAVNTFSVFITVKLLYFFFDFILKKIPGKLFYIYVLIPTLLAASFIMVALNDLILIITGYLQESNIVTFVWFYISANLLTITTFSAIYFIVDQWDKTRLEKENTLRAIALANEAHTLMLRYQINPHFLFNTLNTIRAVILEDREKARTMITGLSDFFRYTLSQNINDTVELTQEIEAVKNYLMIQEIRFEENLKVEIEIDPATENFKIPIFIINPLVENAVKYGIQTGAGILKINISSSVADNCLFLRISNSGHLIDQKNLHPCNENTNTGIQNIIKRLHLFYGDKAAFTLSENNGTVTAEIKINLS